MDFRDNLFTPPQLDDNDMPSYEELLEAYITLSDEYDSLLENMEYLNEIGDTPKGQEMIDRMAARYRQRLHVIRNSDDHNMPTSLKLREKQNNMWQNSMKHLTRAYNRKSYFSDINRRSPQNIAFMRKHFKMNGYK